MTTTELLSALNWRYATKAFDTEKKIPTEKWEALEQSLVLTPSSFGLQPWKFIVVQNAELRETLVRHSWGQRQVADSSHFVVFAAKKELTEADVDAFLSCQVAVRGGSVDALAGYKNVIMSFRDRGANEGWLEFWAKHQTYIALGQLMTAAAALEVDACPMEGLDPAKYDEALGLPAQGLTTSVACALGYRSAADKYAALAKVRFPRESVIEYR
jgi:nitroreductase